MSRGSFNFESFFHRYEQTQRWMGYARRQPSWVLKAAIAVGVLIVVVPLLIIGLVAVLGFGLVFVVLSIVHRLVDLLTRPFRPGGALHRDGRRNVKVIRTQEDANR